MNHTLTRHHDIRNWVHQHRGTPAIRRIPNAFGEVQAKLHLSFRRHDGPHQEDVDDGMSPCSWTAWLAELDRRQLALRVSDQQEPEYEFVARRDLN